MIPKNQWSQRIVTGKLKLYSETETGLDDIILDLFAPKQLNIYKHKYDSLLNNLLNSSELFSREISLPLKEIHKNKYS